MKLKPDPLSLRHPDAATVKARVDLVAYASQLTRLRRSRYEWVGLCPLHTERHPSFFVHPERQIFYCFGCQRGGDVFSLVMYQRECSFPEAVRIVAEFARVGSPPKPKAKAGLSRPKAATPNSWASSQRGEPKPQLVDNSPRDIPPCFFGESATRADVTKYKQGTSLAGSLPNARRMR
jgi:CHC2 zinc finger